LQTLLFTCTKLEFSVKGGASWKNILRKVKHLGLMYSLKEELTDGGSHGAKDVYVEKGMEHVTHANLNENSDRDSKLACSIDGPVSLFQLTDRYGTSIAKLIPVIITSSSWWHLSAFIVRKTMSGKKIYEFRGSSAEFQQLKVREPSRNYKDGSFNSQLTSSYFDSSLEEKFAIRFEHLANRWKIKR